MRSWHFIFWVNFAWAVDWVVIGCYAPAILYWPIRISQVPAMLLSHFDTSNILQYIIFIYTKQSLDDADWFYCLEKQLTLLHCFFLSEVGMVLCQSSSLLPPFFSSPIFCNILNIVCVIVKYLGLSYTWRLSFAYLAYKWWMFCSLMQHIILI